MSAVPSEQEIATLQDTLTTYMERKGASTNKRRSSASLLPPAGHLSIDDMLGLVPRGQRVGYATCTPMKLLVECGLASERQFDDTVTRFEVAQKDGHHDHLICLECKKIVEFEDDEIERLQESLARRYGYKLRSHKHELYGICAGCQRNA